MPAEEIKSCPFCEAEPIRLEFVPLDEGPETFSGCVHCFQCDANGPVVTASEAGEAMDLAYLKWNERKEAGK